MLKKFPLGVRREFTMRLCSRACTPPCSYGGSQYFGSLGSYDNLVSPCVPPPPRVSVCRVSGGWVDARQR